MTNPYESASLAPDRHVRAVTVIPNAEAIRRKHLPHEASLKQCSLLMAGGWALMCGVVLAAYILPERQNDWLPMLALSGYIVIGCATSTLACVAVYHQQTWGRYFAFAAATLSLPLFPLGTAVGCEVLRILLSGPRPKLMTPLYRDVILQTPHLTPRTSWLAWLGAFLLVVLIVAIILISQIPPELRQTR